MPEPHWAVQRWGMAAVSAAVVRVAKEGRRTVQEPPGLIVLVDPHYTGVLTLAWASNIKRSSRPSRA